MTTNCMENVEETLRYNKRKEAAGIKGQLYEIYLTITFLLQGMKKKEAGKLEKFYLATNLVEAHNFDDIVFKYNYIEEGIEKSKVMFLQAKHKENNQVLNLNHLFPKGVKRKDFNLKEYFHSYQQIKKQFHNSTSLDPIFGTTKFEDCNFIIFTSAILHPVLEKNQKNWRKVLIQSEDILDLLENKYYYQLILCGEEDTDQMIINSLEYLTDSNKLAQTIIQSIFAKTLSKTEKKAIAEILREYQVPLVEEVIEKTNNNISRLSKYFLEDHENLSLKCRKFRKVFFEELKKNEEFAHKLDDEIKFELMDKNINLPDRFWNIEIKKIVTLPDREEEIREYLSQLKLYVGQPNEDELSRILSKKIQSIYQVDQIDIETIVCNIKSKIERWWKDNNFYLTEKNKFFDEPMRISIWFDIKKSSDLFTGREQELKDLHNKIQRSSDKITVISQVTTISGLGGIGKTELARQYIQEFKDYYDNNIIWINSESESSFTDSFKRLAKDKLGIKTEDANGKEKEAISIIEDVYKFFKKRKSLFILDNAEKGERLNRFLHTLTCGDSKLYILLTSRNQEWDSKVEVLNLNELDIRDAIILVKKGLHVADGDESQNQYIKTLVEKLQCFPLAIQQAIAYIKDQNIVDEYQVVDFLQEYDESTKDLLDCQKFQSIDNAYTKTTFTTWQITIDKINQNIHHGKLCLKILNFVAYFSPENINRKLFLTLANNNEKLLKQAVRILVDFSLINGEQKQNILSIHRLVQEVTRIKLVANGEEENTLKDILELVENNLDNETIGHVISTWNYSSIYIELVKNFSNLPFKIMKYLNKNSKYREACVFGIKNSKLLDNVIGKSDQNTLNLQIMTAITFYNNCEYDYALYLYQELLTVLMEQLGHNHQNTLNTMTNIGITLTAKGDYDNALLYLEDVLERQKAVIGDEHPSTLHTMHNMAIAFCAKEDFDCALKYYTILLEKRTNILGNDHLETLNTLHNLANVFHAKGQYDEALQYYTIVLEKQKQKLGDQHLDTLCTLQNIANTLRDKGDCDAALKYYEHVLEKRIEKLGSDHLNTLYTMKNIASVLSQKGSYNDALNYYENVLDQQKKKLGDNHPNTLDTMHHIANTIRDKGDYSKALNYYEDLLNRRKENLGDEHRDTLKTLHDMTCLNEMKKESI